MTNLNGEHGITWQASGFLWSKLTKLMAIIDSLIDVEKKLTSKHLQISKKTDNAKEKEKDVK